MKNEIKKLFKELPKDTLLHIDILYNYFKQHPKWDQKISKGFNGFIIKKNEWNYSFHVVGDRNVFTPISINFNVKETHLDQVKKALRTAVQPIVDKVRSKVIYGKTKCELTGEVLTKENTHIDHYDLDFRFLVEQFTKKHKDIKIVKKGVKFYLVDENIKKEWIDFHNNNTKLRPVTATANLKRSKK